MKNEIIKMMVDAGMGNNTICEKCRSVTNLHTNALGPWLVGDASLPGNRILFIGKIARGDCLGEEVADKLEDVTSFGESAISKFSWPYWSYTRAIIEQVYGDLHSGLRHVYFTNMVKCNNESCQDSANEKTREMCIARNRFIWKEIELIKPRLVILYTHTSYDNFINDYMPSYASSFVDNENKEVPIGKKSMVWWDRSFFDERGRETMRLLRIGHPERKKKIAYVEIVSSWISDHMDVANK